MNKFKYHETTRLHYGKYLYKLKIKNELASIFRTDLQRNGNLGYAEQKLKTYTLQSETQGKIVFKNRYFRTVVLDYNDILEASHVYKCLKNSSEYMVRCEHHTLMIYTNDINLLKKIGTKISGDVEIWEPSSSASEFLFNNKNIILVDYYPEFPYKVTFGRKKGSIELSNWIEKNSDKVKAGNSFLENLKNERWISGQYLYAKNEKILLILKVMVGNNISRIDKLVYKADLDK